MRGMIGIVATGLLVTVALVAPTQGAQERLFRFAFFTPPLGYLDSLSGEENTFEASFVSTGRDPVKLTIQLCTLDGVCISSGFGCVDVPLTSWEGCTIGDKKYSQPVYARFLVTRKGGGTVDGLGSLRVIGPDGTNSAAVQTSGSIPYRVITEL